jgi:MOSC domain-containing protein YiiM
MVTRQIGDDLAQDRRLLRTIVREADQNVGVYATVVRGGHVAEGDAVELS